MNASPVTPIRPPMAAYREPASAETEVRSRVYVWCAAWSSVNGELQTAGLRDLAAPGPIRMSSDFGWSMAATVDFDDYIAYWAPLLARTFTDWMLIADAPIGVHFEDDMAAVHFNSRFHGTTREGFRLKQHQHVLQVWEKFERDWRLTHEQTRVNQRGGQA